MSEAKRENFELVGYYNPCAAELYPCPLVPIVQNSGGFALFFGHEIISSVTEEQLKEIQSAPGCSMLKPESKIPFSDRDCVYGVSKDCILTGDLESVIRNLRIALNAIPSDSKEYLDIANFIAYETGTREIKSRLEQFLVKDAELRQLLLHSEE